MEIEMATKPLAVAASTATTPLTLSEQDAWEIAMAWQPQLQGKVRLEIDRDGPANSVVETYAWVRIDDPRPLVKEQAKESARREVLSILRAVMITWASLTSCPGYSGSHNGVFWKRVISELQEKPKKPPKTRVFRGCGFGRRDLPRSVTDTIGFFDLPGIGFPRFMVMRPYELDEAFTKLFTRKGPELAPEVRIKMELLMAKLEPYLQATQVPVIEICLRAYGFFGERQDRTFSALVHSTDAPSGDASMPSFRISHLQFRDVVQLSSPKHVRDVFNLMRDSPISVRDFHLNPLLNGLPPADRARWVQSFLGLTGHGLIGKITSFKFPRHYVDDVLFQALISALPFATSVHSLAFSTECSSRDGMFEQADLPWIAYAIFHPHTAESSWRHLTLETVILTEQSSHVMAAMARGNNLLALVNGTTPDSDAYFSAHLLAGTVVHVQPNPNPASESLFTTPQTGITVDLCGISSLDRATWGNWVTVIIPAYGLGWVCQYEVVDARTHAPAKQSLSSLRLQRNTNPSSGPTFDPPKVLLHILPRLGSLLKYLDISSYANISSATLEQILRACPSLKVLVVGHTARLWSKPLSGIAPLETQLEELQLNVKSTCRLIEMPTLDHIQTSLRTLRALRLCVHDPQGTLLQASQATLQKFLEHVPALRYFEWRADHTWGSLVPYALSLEWTPQALSQLGLTHDKYLYAHEPLRSKCAAAFLSAVARESDQRQSALSRLVDRGVLTTVFQFATSPVKRFIQIESNIPGGDRTA